MAMMDSFDYILNWRLKQGSHTFPGQDGGTCINEAAIMPACFSRPICRLAMQLNDEADDEERQQLLPFVTRLACADTTEVERRRAAYIHLYMTYRLSFQERLEVLEGALAIGRQAETPAPGAVRTRLATVQQSTTTPTSVPD